MYNKTTSSYDEIPEAMQIYINNYGCHFNKKLCEEAISRMKSHSSSTGGLSPIKSYSKLEVDNLLKTYGIKPKRGKLYDHVYVANMCRADFLGSSIQTEEHLAKYVKDVLDDPDTEDGYIFNRFYADTMFMNDPIEWEDMI